MGSEIGSFVTGVFDLMVIIIVVLFLMLMFSAGRGPDDRKKRDQTGKKSEMQNEKKGSEP